MDVSIRAPHEGRDHQDADQDGASGRVSIRAPHEGRDAPGGPTLCDGGGFNPRAP